jgi:hypothetical protein
MTGAPGGPMTKCWTIEGDDAWNVDVAPLRGSERLIPPMLKRRRKGTL